jgi:hypothetical protein
MTTPLLVILVLVVASAIVGIAAGRRGEMTLERWTVGGRSFGVVLVWLLMAGEVYTTFTFLGASGWAYSRGAPAFYILPTEPSPTSSRSSCCRRSGGWERWACTRNPISSLPGHAARRWPASSRWWASSVVPHCSSSSQASG